MESNRKDIAPSGSREGMIDKNVQSENKQKVIDMVKRGWSTFNSYFVYILIASLFGVYIGVEATKKFYSNKMDDCVLVQGLVFKGIPYTITKK